MKLLLGGFGVMAIVVACSGGGASTGPATYDSALGPCRADCEQRFTCNPDRGGTVEECAMECAMEVAGWVRDDVVQTVLECGAALPCDASDDQCLDDVQPLAVHRRYETECRAAMATCFEQDPAAELTALCEVDPGGPGDAGIVRIFAPVVVEALIDCFAEATCEARFTCIDDVVAQFGISF